MCVIGGTYWKFKYMVVSSMLHNIIKFVTSRLIIIIIIFV